MDIEKLLNDLSLEELVGQVLCYDVYERDDMEKLEEIISRIKPGGLFITGMTPERIKTLTDMVNRYTKVPMIMASDVENGPSGAVKNGGSLPLPMAWGAANDEVLLEEAGRLTGQMCRKAGVHWTYSPIVDINYNFRSAECNIRAISDSPERVVRLASALTRGMEENGNLVACAKHFPGQGIDERNSHFVTTINDLSKEEWMATYGYVYKEMIKRGIPSIMVGHGSLPAFEENIDPIYGAPPAVLSKSLMTDLLKGELGFDGCIVSDAMSMIGVAGRVERLEDIAVEFLKAGGDMVLFPEPTDYDNILAAVKEGRLPLERLKDAVRRNLRLKEKARLFENQEELMNSIPTVTPQDISEIAQKIADKSIKVVRDHNHVIPFTPKKGGKVLMVNILDPIAGLRGDEFAAMKDEFEKNGYTVEQKFNAGHKETASVMDEYDILLVNCKMSCKDYHGSTLRVGWKNIMTFWRGYVLHHPNFMFVSFGDPYKLYDMPYLREYINAFSYTDESQRAVVNVLLGKIPAQGKNPVTFKGYFEIED